MVRRYFAYLESGERIEYKWKELEKFWKDKTSNTRTNHWQFPINIVICEER